MKGMDVSAKKVFSEGLCAGFAGGSNMHEIVRGAFRVTSSGVTTGSTEYIDQWIIGGGQEIIQLEDGSMLTRVYAGDRVSQEVLESLEITEADVLRFLSSILTSALEKTRLDEEYQFAQGDWKYSYNLLAKSTDPLLVCGKEDIYYKDTLVFTHILTTSAARES